MTAPLLDVEDLRVAIDSDTGQVLPVRGVSFLLQRGQRLGVVGESGCGKTITLLAVAGLLPEYVATKQAARLTFDGLDLTSLGGEALRALRGPRLAVIFQNPMTSLNPVMTIGEQISEIFGAHPQAFDQWYWADRLETEEVSHREAAALLLEIVGIPNAADRLDDYPHHFSGGMRQRVGIAMALALAPDLIIADEPTTALDVTVQAQVLELLGRLTEETGTALVLISHDLGVIAGHTDTVQVMYAGRIVESGATRNVLKDPLHPYTAGLLRSLPRFDVEQSDLYAIPGAPPDLRQEIKGCAFAPRCEYAEVDCRDETPQLIELEMGRKVACHHPLQAEHAIVETEL